MTVCLKTNGIAVTRFSPNKPNIRGPDSKMLLFPPLISSLCRLGGLYPSAGAKSLAMRFPPARLPTASSEIQLRNKNSFRPGKGIDKTRVNLIIVAHRRKGRVCFERLKVRDCGKKLCFNWSIQRQSGRKTHNPLLWCVFNLSSQSKSESFNWFEGTKSQIRQMSLLSAEMLRFPVSLPTVHGHPKGSARIFLPADFKRSIIGRNVCQSSALGWCLSQ